MNDFLNDYINKKVDEVLGVNPDPQKKQQLVSHLQDLVLDTVLDNLTDQQVLILQQIPAGSPDMETKLEEFSATIPNLAQTLETKINEEVEKLKQNPI